MRVRMGGLALAGAAVLAMGAVSSATTWTVRPGGAVTAKAGTREFQIIDTSTHTGCAVSMTPGELSTFVW